MSRDLTKLPPFDDDGALRVIVESPRGSSVKLAYEPSLRLFGVSEPCRSASSIPSIGDLSPEPGATTGIRRCDGAAPCGLISRGIASLPRPEHGGSRPAPR